MFSGLIFVRHFIAISGVRYNDPVFGEGEDGGKIVTHMQADSTGLNKEQ